MLALTLFFGVIPSGYHNYQSDNAQLVFEFIQLGETTVWNQQTGSVEFVHDESGITGMLYSNWETASSVKYRADLDTGAIEWKPRRDENLYPWKPAGWITTSEYYPLGDSTKDGVFTSTDLIRVFTRNYYERPDRPTDWEHGDWNGDFFFDSKDLIDAFAYGDYEPSRIATVPEPQALWGILLMAALVPRVRGSGLINT